MFRISMLRASSVFLSLLSLAASSPTKLTSPTNPTNNLYLAIDISLSPSNTLTTAAPTCTEEGFHPNPKDCSKFFHCVDFGNGTLTRFDFDCGPGTGYDADLITCNHPWTVDRNSKCYSAGPDTAARKTKYTTLDTTRDTKKGKQVTLASDGKATKRLPFDCITDGIFADPSDCVTYHECTKDAKGGFTHDVEVRGDDEMFCPPVGGCGPAAGCPVACSEGGEPAEELIQEELK